MKNIEILRIMSLRGPNIWTYRSTLEAWIDIGELEDFPSNTLPGFNQRLTGWLPSLIEHRCSYGERGGFVQRLQDGTWPGHILEHVTLELQNLAGMPGGFGKARSTSVRGVYKVAVRARHEEVTRAALHAARDLVMAAIEDQPFDVPATIASLRTMVDSRCLGPSTACIVEAADERRIPSFRLTDGNLVQLGHGFRQRRIWTAETDQTSAIAESISSDKDLTKTLLQACGVPVPEGLVVDSPAEAWEAAEDIGLPVVVKPTDANHGRGVFIDLNTREEIETAYTLALEEGSSVIVERFIRGNEHRLLIVGGRLAAAARGEPLSVVADGSSTILQLIESQINSDPRRGELEECPLSLVLLDQEPVVRVELERQGYNGDSIPPAGKQVLIQRNGNVSIDVTDLVHPSVAAAASLAARVVGLDIAGVDLVAEDISRPLEEQRGAIVEVNAGPGLLMHLKPAEGRPRPVGRAIIEHLFAAADNGRIPIVGVSGTHGKTTVSRLIAWQLHLSGNHVGLACGDGLYFAQRQVEKGDCANWESAQRVLINRAVQAAVFENSHDTILSEGLVYDRCQVGVVTNIAANDSLPQYYIGDAEEMVKVTRTQVDVVLPTGVAVLNAADALVADMASLCDGEVIFFGINPALPVIAEQLEKNKRAVFIRNDQIMLATGKNELLLADITTIPLITRSKDSFQTENVLAAVAAAWALDISHDLMRAGIETFEMA
ncbi:cyanophycin synthetase [Collimonas pratensis]|uniref:cyanophycin synthetase n=1 Tax=Collimonas pratensis TaxID=279113 RepID=UPI00143DFF06|nr:cyanophycin synthetase [Collimonas pratensis]NKI70309.1 cyanophycin synthetase [Collimonas pratensis]